MYNFSAQYIIEAYMIFNSILVALGLAMDAFAVSLGVGTGKSAQSRRSKLRLAFHFGIFQSGMTLLGWLGGNTIERLIRSVDHWLAFLLLAYVGGRMILAGIRTEQESYSSDPSKGGLMVMLSLATSMDALAVGLSMAMIGSPIVIPSLIIGIVAFGLSAIGLFFGHQLGNQFGKRMEILGGVILIGIGVRIVLTHLFAGG
ncbi:MAG: manganese efflux pump MntP family protein [Chloroflexota bacterium]